MFDFVQLSYYLEEAAVGYKDLLAMAVNLIKQEAVPQ
jgi:hypothetical protein